MRKSVCLFAVLTILLCACQKMPSSDYEHPETERCVAEQPQEDLQPTMPEEIVPFTKNESGNLVSDAGVEYAFVAMETDLFCLGERAFYGQIEGEEELTDGMSDILPIGIYALKGDENKNILVRRYYQNEWYGIYRKGTLPPLAISQENYCRLELVYEKKALKYDVKHKTCGDGISDPVEIAAFFSDVRTQKSPEEAGIYERITGPNGYFRNCYVYGAVYCYFAEEPDVAVRLVVTSYNDLAYSVAIDDREYLLPQEWIERLQGD